jgi:hypothetical protein
VLYRQSDPSAVAHGASRPAAAVARGARPLAPWPTTPRLGHAKGPLLAAPTAMGHDIRGLAPMATTQMYIFAKFVADHIFLQNRDKINIKKIVLCHCPTLSGLVRAAIRPI